MKALAIDFDEVIHNPYIVKPGYKMGIPMPGTIEAMRQLREEGYALVIYTLWGDTPQKITAVQDWLNYFGIPYSKVTNTKPDADAYIDNKAIRFQNWAQTLNDIKRLV